VAKATTQRRRRDRRDDLNTAAIRIFFEKGFASASIQDVADEVGVLKGSVYHYISSKEDLLKRIFDDEYAFRRSLFTEAAQTSDPGRRLWLVVERYVLWQLENVEHATVVQRESRHLTGRLAATTRRRNQSFETGLLKMIREAQAISGIDDLPNPRHVLLHILGAIESVSRWYRPSGTDRPSEIASIYADLTLNAVVGAPSPDPSPQAQKS
jgi:AcrR family transcriptional regulator